MEKHRIFEKFEELVKAHGFVLIDLTLRGDNHLRIIEVFIDGEKGVNSMDCANISRALNSIIDTEKLIESHYRLDVSSPGVDRPLKYLIQYGKHINRKFEVTFTEGEIENNIIAKLLRIEGEYLFFIDKETEFKINFNNIKKAKVIISF